MKNIVSGVDLCNYAILATVCSFRLLFRCRTSPALSPPERILPFEQDSLLLDGRAFPGRLGPPKPDLPWGAGANFRLACSGSGPGAALVVSSPAAGPNPDIVCQ